MTESQFQTKLLRALKQHPALKDAVIFKHSDRFNRGVPDFSVTINGRTTWWEIKMLPNRPTKIQSYYLNKLAPVSYVIFVRGNSWEVAGYSLKKLFDRAIGDKFDLLLMVITENCSHV
jgi:hypothetical protein